MSKPEEIKVDYKKLRAQGKKILDRVNGVYKVETRYAIIMAINNFGSSNIKKLAQLLGKNEATIYHHLKDLTREPELLVVDNKKTRENKEIFYKLSKIAERNFGEPHVKVLENKIPSVNINNTLKELLMLPEVEMIMITYLGDEDDFQWWATKVPITEELKLIAEIYRGETKSTWQEVGETLINKLVKKYERHYHFTTMLGDEEVLIVITTKDVEPFVEHMATLVKMVGHSVGYYELGGLT